jgi:hypothetical protein
MVIPGDDNAQIPGHGTLTIPGLKVARSTAMTATVTSNGGKFKIYTVTCIVTMSALVKRHFLKLSDNCELMCDIPFPETGNTDGIYLLGPKTILQLPDRVFMLLMDHKQSLLQKIEMVRQNQKRFIMDLGGAMTIHFIAKANGDVGVDFVQLHKPDGFTRLSMPESAWTSLCTYMQFIWCQYRKTGVLCTPCKLSTIAMSTFDRYSLNHLGVNTYTLANAKEYLRFFKNIGMADWAFH